MAGPSDVADGLILVKQFISAVGWPVILSFSVGVISGGIVTRHFVLRRMRKRGLVVLRELGIKMLLNRYIGPDLKEQNKSLESDCGFWERMAVETLRQLRVADEKLSNFAMLGTISRPRMEGADETHARIRTITAEKLDRLLGILQGLRVYSWQMRA